MSELFTITEACAFAGVTDSTIYAHLNKGNLTGKRIPNPKITPKSSQPFIWLVDRESLESYYYSVKAGRKQHTARSTAKIINALKVRWVNVYPKGEIDPYLFKSKKEAKENADVDVVDTRAIQITV